MVFVWACGRKARALAVEWDHFPTRSGFNQGPSLVVHLGLVGTTPGIEQDFATTGGWGTSKATRADRVHAAAVVEERANSERANSGQRVVFATSADPIGFRSSKRDVEAQSAVKEHTSDERGDNGGLGVRRPGADLGQRWSR